MGRLAITLGLLGFLCASNLTGCATTFSPTTGYASLTSTAQVLRGAQRTLRDNDLAIQQAMTPAQRQTYRTGRDRLVQALRGTGDLLQTGPSLVVLIKSGAKSPAAWADFAASLAIATARIEADAAALKTATPTVAQRLLFGQTAASTGTIIAAVLPGAFQLIGSVAAAVTAYYAAQAQAEAAAAQTCTDALAGMAADLASLSVALAADDARVDGAPPAPTAAKTPNA